MKVFNPDRTVVDITEADQAIFRPEAIAGKLARIIRFQGDPRAMSVLSHQLLCYDMAMVMCEYLCVSLNVAEHLLVHDVCEAFTGDYNGVIKPTACITAEKTIERHLVNRGWRFIDPPGWHVVDKLSLLAEQAFEAHDPSPADDYAQERWCRLVYDIQLYVEPEATV